MFLILPRISRLTGLSVELLWPYLTPQKLPQRLQLMRGDIGFVESSREREGDSHDTLWHDATPRANPGHLGCETCPYSAGTIRPVVSILHHCDRVLVLNRMRGAYGSELFISTSEQMGLPGMSCPVELMDKEWKSIK